MATYPNLTRRDVLDAFQVRDVLNPYGVRHGEPPRFGAPWWNRLHIAGTEPPSFTAGDCLIVFEGQLSRVMRWERNSDHPDYWDVTLERCYDVEAGQQPPMPIEAAERIDRMRRGLSWRGSR